LLVKKKSYIRRYKRIFRRKRYFKRKIEKYTNLLKHRLSARERVFYNKLLADAQKDQHKYLESMRIRKILRNRRACIRSYARTTRRFNNYRRRTLRIIKKTNNRRIGEAKRLVKYCKVAHKSNYIVCYKRRIAKIEKRRKIKDAKKDLRRKLVVAHLRAKIAKLSKKCDLIHKKAEPFLRSRKQKSVDFPTLSGKKLTYKKCNIHHSKVVTVRRYMIYRSRKSQLNNRIKRIKKRCTFIKSTLREKRLKCKQNKCFKKSNKKISSIRRQCIRRLRRTRRSLRRNSRRYRKALRNVRKNKEKEALQKRHYKRVFENCKIRYPKTWKKCYTPRIQKYELRLERLRHIARSRKNSKKN